MAEHDEFIASNRELWDGWAELHVASDFYDVEGFVADPDSRPLDPLVLGVVGDVRGKRLLHLQCHFGMDTLRLARMGAEVTGVDFSAKAITAARELSARIGVPGTFVESDVRELPDEVEREAFDVVFTSHGVLSWLPNLTAWGESVASRLAPGGRLNLIEMHPTLWMFDEQVAEPPLALHYSYFDKSPLRWEEKGSYADPDADFEGVSYSWQHTFEHITSSILSAGLVIESLREYDRIAWQHIPFMTRDTDGMWILPREVGHVPLMYSIVARKP